MSAQNGNGRTDHWPAPNERRILEGTERPSGFALGVPLELIEAVAHRIAEILEERLPNRPEPYLDVERRRVLGLPPTGSMTCAGTVA